MRNHFLPFIIILFFSACTGRDTNYWLEQAESYLNMKPDSTLILLHKIKILIASPTIRRQNTTYITLLLKYRKEVKTGQTL